MAVSNRFPSTLLAQSNDPQEIQKADLDLLKKVNRLYSDQNTINDELVAVDEGLQDQLDAILANSTIVESSGTGISLTGGTPINICSIVIPAGKWDISGAGGITPTTTTSVTSIIFSGSNTSNTLGTGGYASIPSSSTGEFRIRPMVVNPTVYATANMQTYVIPTYRVVFTATTTLYLIAQCNFTVSTLTGAGWLQARRVY
jgi:hypothetical protein